jgi:hypothetical protein
MSDIALARACCAIPLYISLIALASCSRHARPLAPASPPPATHSLCREQFCRLALLYCMRVGCLLCCCLFIRQSPAGLPPSASVPSSAPNSDNCWSLMSATVTAFWLWRFLAGITPYKSLPHPNTTSVPFWSKEILSKTVGGRVWSISVLSTESSLQGWRSDQLYLI